MMIKPDMPPIFTEPFEEEPSLYARTFDEDIRILKCSLVDIIGGKVDEWPPVAFDLFNHILSMHISIRIVTFKIYRCHISMVRFSSYLLKFCCAMDDSKKEN